MIRDTTETEKHIGETEPSAEPEQRLYFVSSGVYVQYGGKGKKPKELERYIEAHGGEFPPYFPLTKKATHFYVGSLFLGENYTEQRKIYWDGKGPLPAEILEYVKENGTIPRHTEA